MRRGASIVGVGFAAVAVSLPWFLIVRELRHPQPVVSTSAAPTAIVWGGRAFTSRGDFQQWLHSRGASYLRWATIHPRPQTRPIGVSKTRLMPAIGPSGTSDTRATSKPYAALGAVGTAAHAVLRRHTAIITFAFLLLGTLTVASAVAPPGMRRPLPLVLGSSPPVEIRLCLAGIGIAVLVGVAVTSALG
jgi:hypothetical protein